MHHAPVSAPSSPAKSSLSALTLAALGVVYGDIGTSPLYALREVFASGHVPLSPDNIYGVLSMIFWTLTVVVSVKYVALILRADNNGEGGLIAMLALASTAVAHRPALRRRLLLLGIFGTAIFFGDGVITPAISVLSAVEGLEVAAPGLENFVVPLTLLVLTALFAVQRHGTGGIGRYFGPVTALWFVVLTVLGAMHIVRNPSVLWALSPHHALLFITTHIHIAFVALASVVLCVTGAEALYADMGHFGKRPIRFAWFGLVMPALVINYFGQGAMLLDEPSKVSNPFYEMAPAWALYPLIAIATCATVIASQALITAAFSVTKQVIQLGYLPRMRIVHTSVRETGQIYVPFINWTLLVAVSLLIVGFQSSSALAGAYGIAVTMSMLIDSILIYFVMRRLWRWPRLVAAAIAVPLVLIDAAFLASNSLKIPDGGWFPLLVGAVVFTMLTTWKRGRKVLMDRLSEDALPLREFIQSIELAPPVRVEGTAVFLTSTPDRVPHALLHNLNHNNVLHERVVFLTVVTKEIPFVAEDERIEIETLGCEFYRMLANYGFKDEPDVPDLLEMADRGGFRFQMMETSFFVSRETLIASVRPGMAMWRERLFSSMSKNAVKASDFFHVPANRVVELGTQVEL